MKILSGYLGGRVLKVAKNPDCRPAMGRVRNALFSMLEARGLIFDGLRVLDLFAGSGSMGFEAISRGADKSFFVEYNKEIAASIRDNARCFGLGADKVYIFQKKVEYFLKKRNSPPFDLIFVDPPYRMNLLARALRAIVTGGWLGENGTLVAEVEKDLTVPKYEELTPVADRSYGQTRILVWTRTKGLPFIPELSTP